MRALLLASLLFAACGAAYGTAGAGGGATPSASAVTATVTMADNNGSLTVHVGDRIQIALGEQPAWKLDPPDGVVLTHPVQNYMLVRGTQAIWLASAPGTSTIHATAGGAPTCPAGAACPQYVVNFSVVVHVIPG